MKKIALYLSVLVVFSLPFLLYISHIRSDNANRVLRFQRQLGSYILDVSKTSLGEYARDGEHYSKLTIEFRKDSTFYMNMKVPFIYDSVGTWLVGGSGLEDWNRLFYKRWNYRTLDKNAGNQFDQCCLADSTFYINGATPDSGAQFIQEIYFKKLSD